jgi:hypothetical protein
MPIKCVIYESERFKLNYRHLKSVNIESEWDTHTDTDTHTHSSKAVIDMWGVDFLTFIISGELTKSICVCVYATA